LELVESLPYVRTDDVTKGEVVHCIFDRGTVGRYSFLFGGVHRLDYRGCQILPVEAALGQNVDGHRCPVLGLTGRHEIVGR
jgi:hypothetical protein